MQERNQGENGAVDAVSVEDLFLGIQESYSEAQSRALEENKSFVKTEFFRLDKLGVYRLRILPIAPSPTAEIERKGYEFPVHQLLMEIEKPTTGGKPQNLYVSVPRATDAGFSVDIIDTYRKLAVSCARDMGDEKLADKIGGGSFGGGLRFNFGHAMYVYDLNERSKGIQLLTLSNSQFKDMDERKFKLWEKKLQKNPHYPCPISSVYNAYPIEIEKRKNGGKTEYLFNIDNESDNDILAKEELTALINAPRIPEIIYRYSRYQFEATLEYLKQCDVKYGMQILADETMQETIEKLRAELPKEDTSSFSFDRRSKEAKESTENSALSMDTLFSRYDQLQQDGLGDKTEEGQELRAMIRTYIEQEKLPVRVTRSTTNGELLDQIEDAVHDAVPQSAETAVDATSEESTSRKR